MSTQSRHHRLWPWIAMGMAPLFFSTNLVFGRSLADELNPFFLAYIRWQLVALLLTPFVFMETCAAKHLIIKNFQLLMVMGFLGMFVSGALVYLALHHTTAINSALIYTTSPLIILVIEAVFNKRAISKREMIGVTLAFFGVVVIVLRGNFAVLSGLQLNIGDVLIGVAAFSWAAYSVLYKRPQLKSLSNLALFGIIAWAGALSILPAVFFLGLTIGLDLPKTDAWLRIFGLVFLSSIAAFGLFQYGIRSIGASVSGLFMYLMPVYGVFLAIAFLGEAFERFHTIGILAVLTGVVLATFPIGLIAFYPKDPKAGNVSNNQKAAL